MNVDAVFDLLLLFLVVIGGGCLAAALGILPEEARDDA